MANIQYYTEVFWDPTIREVGTDEVGLAIDAIGIVAGDPGTPADKWRPGALVQNQVDGLLRRNAGSTAAPSWVVMGSGGGGTPSAPVNSIQFNNAGAFGGSADFTIDDVAKTLSLGDGLGTLPGGGTMINIRQPGNIFQILNGFGQEAGRFVTTSGAINVGIGDLSSSGNSTLFQVADGAQIIQGFTNNFSIKNPSTGSTWFNAQTIPGIINIGDVSSVGNDTTLVLNDTTRSIAASARVAGTGGYVSLDSQSVNALYSSGISSWGIAADDTGGGRLIIYGGTSYLWPAAAPIVPKVLQTDASGNLSWVDNGVLSGTPTQVIYYDGLGNPTSDPNFTRVGASQATNIKAESAGVGSVLAIDQVSAGLYYTSGVSSWGFFTDSTGGGRSYIYANNNAFTWPNALGAAGSVLTDVGGTGILSWVVPTTGTITGGGSANQVAYFTGASAIASNGDFLWNPTTKIFSVGDIGSTANDTVLTVDDTTNIITIQAPTGQVNIGDPNSIGNDTVIRVDDNGRQIDLEALNAGVGSQARVYQTASRIVWTDGVNYWGHAADNTGGGRTLTLVGTAQYIWPAADAAGALTSDGAGNLSWSTPGAPALTNAHIFVGNVGNVATDVPMSGEATISNTGAVTISDSVKVYSVKVTIPSAACLTLNTIPVDLVTAPGVGKAVQVLSANVRLRFNTTPYATNTNLRLVNATQTPYVIGTANICFSASADCASSFTLSQALNNFVENDAIQAFVSTGDPTGGDSDIDVYVTYKIITL